MDRSQAASPLVELESALSRADLAPFRHSSFASERLGAYVTQGVIFAGSPVRVMLASHVDLPNDLVALKCFDRKLTPHPERIEREIAASRAAQHENIIRFIEAFETEQEVCICMEFGHGGDLFSHLSRRGALPESEAARLFTHLLRALEFCHRTVHLCHRDVKPENLLFDSTDSKSRVLKLVDFGLSCPISESMLQGACGTPVYSAPEVFAQRYDGVRADLWSAAVTLYVMVSGRLPFEVEHPMRQQSLQLSSRSSLNMHGSSLHGSSLNMQSSNTQGSSLNSGSSSGTTSIPTNGGLGTEFHSLARLIQSGRYRPLPASLSPALHDLLAQMLHPDPAQRPLHDEIFNHPWLKHSGEVIEDDEPSWHDSYLTRSRSSNLQSIASITPMRPTPRTLSSFGRGEEVDLSNMTPLQAARSLTRWNSSRGGAAYSVNRRLSATNYPAANNATSSLTTSNASWVGSWMAARTNSASSPQHQPSVPQTSPPMRGRFGSPTLAPLSPPLYATHTSDTLQDSRRPSTGNHMAALSIMSALRLDSDERFSEADCAIQQVDDGALPTIDESEPAHWCGAADVEANNGAAVADSTGIVPGSRPAQALTPTLASVVAHQFSVAKPLQTITPVSSYSNLAALNATISAPLTPPRSVLPIAAPSTPKQTAQPGPSWYFGLDDADDE